MVLNHLVDALRKMPPDFTAGQKFNVVTVSFDPKEHADLAKAKRESYLKEYGRDGAEWRFLTGGKDAIKELTEAVGFKYEFDRAFKEYNHPSGIIVLTPDGKTSRYFLGLGYAGEYANKAKTETTTLRMSLVEASDGKLGSLLDRMWLSCYRFDHTTKKYSPYVMGIVRIAGIVTMVVMAAAVFTFVRLDRRKRAAALASNHPAADANAGQSGETH
jgi:protein SCO1/2